MRHSKSILFLTLICQSLVHSEVAQAAEEYWQISKVHAQCFLENIEKYQESNDEPVVVFLKVCPTVDRATAIQELQKNSQTPRIREQQSGNELDEVLVFNKSELACLRGFDIMSAGAEIQIPKEPGCNH